MSRVIRITPQQFIHVLDNNTNITRIEIGPQTFTRKDHEQVVLGPQNMITIPAGYYCIIANPVIKQDGELSFDKFGSIKLQHGHTEVRLAQEPFPLYPGETMSKSVSELEVVAPNQALKLRATRDFVDGQEINRVAGDEWLFEGPATYIPRVEVSIVETVMATILKPNEALRLTVLRDFRDQFGIEHRAGESFMVRENSLNPVTDSSSKSKKRNKQKRGGAYLPSINEQVEKVVNGHVLTDSKALHLCALQTFTDVYNIERKAGDEWLVTIQNAECHIPDVYENVVGSVHITTLSNRQYCTVLDYVDSQGTQHFGQRQVRTNTSFFLHPGERLEDGVQNILVLGEDEALLLTAVEGFMDGEQKRMAGERWMIHGPCDFIPPTQVEIVERRKVIPLDKNEGVYIRDVTSGRVRAVIGESYMLKSNEELFEKEMPETAERLLSSILGNGGNRQRDKTRAIAVPVPHNTAVQVYDYLTKRSRVVFGPELVMLAPDEHLTLLSLSGGKPKQPHVIKALMLNLGPDFSTDIVTVETLDHARLELKLSYNWHFDVTDNNSAPKIFQVPDFVGDMCKQIGSRVRAAVASTTFDDFHKESARIIRSSVFGYDENNKIKEQFIIPANNLVVTNIDIQSIEPVDRSTQESLQKSVHMAIEITTKSQEAAARHESMREEQQARGKLERQMISDQVESERAKIRLIQLQAESAAVERTGQANAESKARCEAALIEAEAAVKQAELQAEASRIESEAELMQIQRRRDAEVHNKKRTNDIEIEKTKELADIETKKFQEMVEALGADTISKIATAGPETQAKLLKGLGLKGMIVTDGKNPVNLFSTANGLIGAQQ